MIDSEKMTLTHDSSTWRTREWSFLLGLLILTIVLSTPIAWHWRTSGDFEYHNATASRLLTEADAVLAEVPNFLYHVLVGIPDALTPNISADVWGVIVMVLSAVATAMVLYLALRGHIEHPTSALRLGIIGVVLAFLVVVPINFFTPENLYFGYFTNNVYHNPTVNLMKPFALLLFFWVLRLYDADFQPRFVGLWLIAYLSITLLGLLAKPSFIIAFLPALGLVTLYQLIKRKAINWWLLMGGVVLPAGALLFYQIFVMISPEAGGGIRFEPMRVFLEWTLHYEPYANVGLLEKLLLSIAFPLVVYGLYWRTTKDDLAFNLTWLTLLVGLAYSYLLVDDTEIAAGNFIWSAQSAVVILFAVALVTLIRSYRPVMGTWTMWLRQEWRMIVSLIILGLHLVAGIHWYILHMTTSYSDIIFIWW